MASHSPYPHQGPGPSTYYQPSPPPPQHIYGNHSPVPRPNFYHYPPPPPHMNPHPTGQYQHPVPTRGSHRGGSVNGSYSSRGTHHYQHNYHQQPPYAHAHVTPPLNIQHPHPQHAGQHMPYSAQPAKFNQPYSPSYHYPSPTAPVFTPSWQQQPISPLPKQLSMLPSQNIQTFYEPSHAPPQPEVTPNPQITDETTLVMPTIETTSAPPSPTPADAIVISSGALTPSEGPSTPSSPIEGPPNHPQSSSYSQMGTIQTSESSEHNASSTTTNTVINSTVQWAIWSRRPRDPSQAPGIIISPRARPPPDIIHQAIGMKTPPRSRPTTPAPAVKHMSTAANVITSSLAQRSDDIAVNVWSSQTDSTVPSSSVTESTNTPIIPGSPASSHTSISASGLPAKDAQDILIQSDADQVSETTSASRSAIPDSASASMPAVATNTISPETENATTDVNAHVVPGSLKPALPIIPAPAAAAASAPKKSWASLLRPASSPSPASATTASPAGSSRNTLPTSSVVGFSISAAAPNEGPAGPVSPSKKSDLITLLATGPIIATGFAAAAASTNTHISAPLKIHPRGLVNSGNMCFANSVLQILVYCPPFHRLFLELGKLLVGPVVGGAVAIGKDDTANGATPLVDATAAFLQEFVEDKRRSARPSSRKVEVVMRGGGGSGGSGGKGKEKEIKENYQMEDEDDWGGDSFLPGYVYDAMKAKKRFDHMRGGHQEDAEEFFGFYLDTLEEELLSILNSLNPPRQNNLGPGSATSEALVEEKEETAPPEDDGWLEVGKRNRTVVTRTIKATESPISRIFGGKFRSTLRAPGQKDSVIVEDWRSLRLDIQRDQIHTIQDALSFISHPQSVQINQPTKPGITIEAQQQILIEALPPILVLHIKRFCYDTNVGGVVKVGKHVRFGPELEIGPDVMVPAAKKTQGARYKLFGAVYHHGLSASGGHYTLDVLHPNRYPSLNPASKPREGWVRIDDELVSDVRPDDVFNAHERDDSRCAYLLFYRRI